MVFLLLFIIEKNISLGCSKVDYGYLVGIEFEFIFEVFKGLLV